MPEQTPTTPQDSQHAKARGTVHNLSFEKNGPPATVVNVSPGDTVNFHGINLNTSKIDITGRDVTVVDNATGHKIVMPDLALYLFSSEDAPVFIFDGTTVSSDVLLSHVGAVNNMSENDYVAFTSQNISQNADAAAATKAAQAEAAASAAAAAKAMAEAKAAAAAAAAATTAALMQAAAVAAAPPPQNDDTSPPATPADPSLTSRQTEDTQGVPPVPASNNPPPTPPGSSGVPPVPVNTDTNTSNAAAAATLNFSAELLQVGATDNTSAPSPNYLGGDGAATATLDPSNAAQFSTQIIDLSTNSHNLTVYGNNPSYFSSTEMTRVISVTPSLPSGFDASKVVISGLPTGYSILMPDGTPVTAGTGNSYTIANPILNANGAVEFLVQYNPATVALGTPFTLSISVTADFDPTSGVTPPTTNEFTLSLTKTVITQSVDSADGYTYTDSNNEPGWVLATVANSNKILGGSGADTIYAGNGGDTIIAGNGNNLIYGGVSSDSIVGGAGNNMIYASLGGTTGDTIIGGGVSNATVAGGGGNDTINFSNATSVVTINLANGSVSGWTTDTISGFNNVIGSGNNDYIYTATGHDTIIGGTGSNTIDFSQVTGASNINLSSGLTTGSANDSVSNFTTVFGSNFGDTITGSTGSDSIIGGTGHNLINATAGNDTLIGSSTGSGVGDTISFASATGPMNINLVTNSATGWGSYTDSISNFKDVVASNFGDLITGNGSNVIYSGAGSDTIYGGGNSTIFASTGNDSLYGGTGVNTLNFSTVTTNITVNLASDTASGWGGTDTLNNLTNIVGTSGVGLTDVFYGTNGGSDTITGGISATNIFYASLGSHDFVGGVSGNNTIDFSNDTTGAVNVDLATQSATGYGAYTLSGIQNIVGSATGNDTLTGSTSSGSTITTGSGNDLVFVTNGGTNTFTNNTAGRDTLDFGNATTGSSVVLGASGSIGGWSTGTQTGFYNFIGSSSITGAGDTVTAALGSVIVGGSGNDLFNTDFNNVSINTGAGTDTVRIEGGTGTTVTGGGGASDLLEVTSADLANTAVTLHLDTGTQTLTATGTSVNFSGFSQYQILNTGNDIIYGSTGHDTITTGSGNNLFYANTGQENLNGGVGGNDTLSFANIGTSVQANLAVTSGIDTASGWGNIDTISNFNHIVGSTNSDYFYVGASNMTIDGGGGAGSDTMSFNSLTSALTMHLDTGTASDASGHSYGFSNIKTFVGTNNNDTIYGSTTGQPVETVHGGSGSNFFYAGSGNDSFDGGSGVSTNKTNTLSFANDLSGTGVTVNMNNGSVSGWNNDTISNFNAIIGSTNSDTFYATNAADTFYGGGGSDALSYNGLPGSTNIILNLATGTSSDGSHTDAFYGITSFYGTNNNDTIYGSTGPTVDTVTGGTGSNSFYVVNNGSDVFYSGNSAVTQTLSFTKVSTNDTINLTADTATGWGGTDTFYGFNNVVGSGQSDLIYVNAQNTSETIDGGGGSNTLSFAGTTIGSTINLQNGLTSGWANDSLTNIQSVIGSDEGDTIYGFTNTAAIYDGLGSDLIYTGGSSNLFINSGAGNDTVVVGTGTSDLIYGNNGSGSDTLQFNNLQSVVLNIGNHAYNGASGSGTFYGFGDYILGNTSNNTIFGSSGNDSITGGAGSNFFYASAGTDSLNGGSGTGNGQVNTLDFVYATSAITINLAGSESVGGWSSDQISNFNAIIGSTNNDYMYAGAGNETFSGGGSIGTGPGSGDTLSFAALGGAVSIDLSSANGVASNGSNTDNFSGFTVFYGNANLDTIYGSTGGTADSIYGGGGGNIFYANTGSDAFYGGGIDTLSFARITNANVTVNLHANTATVGAATDTISGFESIYGSAQNDYIYTGATGNDSFNGGGGNNTISFFYATSSETINMSTSLVSGAVSGAIANFTNIIGSNNGDVIYGFTNTVAITGGSGADIIYTDSSNLTVNTGTGNDTVVVGTGTGDNLQGNGGFGTDTVQFNNLQNVTLNLFGTYNYSGASGSGSVSGFTSYILGNTTSDTIYSSNGSDTVVGGTAANLFVAGAGNENLNGGSSSVNDTLSFANISSKITVNLAAAPGSETATGWGGTDTIANFNNIIGSNQSDYFYAGTFNETINGGGGTGIDSLSLAGLTNTVILDLNNNFANAGANDTIHFSNIAAFYGNNSNDIVYGSTNSQAGETVQGGTGSNLFYAGVNSDSLYGGSGTGSDTLSFAQVGSGVTINLHSGRATVATATDSISNFSSIIGSAQSDYIYSGSSGAESLNGGTGGTDTVSFVWASGSETINMLTNSVSGAVSGTINNFTNIIGSNNGDVIYGFTNTVAITGGTGADAIYTDSSNLTVNTGTGNDTVVVGTGTGDNLQGNGGSGSDTLQFTALSNVVLNLNAATQNYSATGANGTISGFANYNLTNTTGGDTVYGSTKSDTVIGGTSSNNIFYANTGHENLNGGSNTNTNTLSFANDTTGGVGITVNLAGTPSETTSGWTTDTISNFNSIVGSGYNDYFYAGSFNETISGNGGTDSLSFASLGSSVTLNLSNNLATGGASDIIHFSNISTFYGSPNNDTVIGSTNTQAGEIIYGGVGSDLFYAGVNSDTLSGGGGTDTLSFAKVSSGVTINLSSGTGGTANVGSATDSITGFSNIVGSTTSDFIYVNAGGSATITGGGGTDTISFAKDTTVASNINLTSGLTTGYANDSLSGFTVLYGSSKNDTITGASTGTDIIYGGASGDVFYASAGNSIFYGNSGVTNVISFGNDTRSGVTFNLNTGVASVTGWGNDTVTNFNVVYGSNEGDIIYGATTGSYTISGGSGINTVYGAQGNGSIYGGSNTSSQINFSQATSGITINLAAAQQTVSGWGNDTISGFGNIIGSNNGTYVYINNSGNDTINGGTGSNTLSFVADTITGSSTINLSNGTIINGAISDHLTANDFTTLYGSNFGDVITGTTGNDLIYGGLGNDLFYATTGKDTYTGNGGIDSLSFVNDTKSITLDLRSNSSSDTLNNTTTFSGISVFYGSNNGDVIYASTQTDTIYGGAGASNLFYAGTGSDYLYGGNTTHINTLSFAQDTTGAGVTVNLAGTNETVTGWATDTISNFTSIIGSSNNDFFYAAASADTFTGGGGSDTLSYIADTGAVTINLINHTSVDQANNSDSFSGIVNFIGSNGSINTVYGDSIGGDTINGGANGFVFIAGSGADSLVSTGGNTVINFSLENTSSVINLASGRTSGFASDTLVGIGIVTGGNYNDTIYANNGTDIITGGTGSDVWYGSSGSGDHWNANSTLSTNTLSYADSNVTTNVTINLYAPPQGGYVGTVVKGGNLTNTDWFGNVSTIYGSNNGDIIYGSTVSSAPDAYHVIGGSGNDVFYAGFGNDAFDGGGGNNTLSFAQFTSSNITVNLANSTATGWGGTDSISNFTNVKGTNTFGLTDVFYGFNAGSDTITGGGGALNIFYASTGTNTFNGGGAGATNTLDFSNDTAGGSGVTINLAGNSATGYGTYTLSNIQVVNGTGYGDTIYGGTITDTINGGAGNDLVFVNKGSNSVYNGGGGTNTLDFALDTVSGSGAVVNLGATGSITGWATGTETNFLNFIGGSANDTVTAASGSSITGGVGNDVFITAATGVNIVMGASANTLEIEGGTSTITGGSGDNNIFEVISNTATNAVGLTLNLATDSLTGGAISTSFATGQFSSYQILNTNSDTIYGSNGNDSVLGGGGNNYFYASLGSDTLNGGTGLGNTLDFSGINSALTINLGGSATATGWGGTDHISNFHDIIGSTLNDLIFVNQSGNDTLDGGLGTNTISFANDTANAVIDFRNSVGSASIGTVTDSLTDFTNIIGSNTHSDIIYGGTNTATITATGSGSDLIVTDSSGLTVNATGSGNDTIMIGIGSSDTIHGGAGSNLLEFNNLGSVVLDLGSSTYSGTSSSGGSFSGFNDFSLNNASNNTIYGSTGNDTVIAGNSIKNSFYENAAGGSDHFTGGANFDAFYATLAGSDTYTGSGGTDTLGYNSLSANLTITLSDSGGATIAKAGGGTDTFNNISSNDSIYGSSGSNSFTLDTTALTSFSGGADTINGGNGGNNTVKINEGGSSDTNVNAQIANLFTNVNTLDLSALTNDNWGTGAAGNVTDTELSQILGTAGGTQLNITVANGSNFANSLATALGNDTAFTAVTSGNHTTYTETGQTHHNTIVVTAV